jgi:hypothetical protein
MKKNSIILIALLVLFIPAIWQLFGPGYFNMHDDLQVMRLFQMDKCFADGQIPCRWVPDMAWGYGQAMFNFYSVTPYYFGYILKFVSGFSYTTTVLLMFMASFILSGIGMYFLAREFWGKWGAVLSAILYVYAPYHSLDVYIRGAMAESFALAFLPFIWWGFYRLIKKPSYLALAGTSISLAALLTTHNISSMIFAPFTGLWVLFWLVQQKDVKRLWHVSLVLLIGVGLSSFFTLPLIFEKPLIQTHWLTIDYLDFKAHFVNLEQLLLDRSWGHGPSIFGPEDEISFQIGWPHWWLGIATFVCIGYKTIKGKKLNSKLFMVLGVLAMAGVTAFLTHTRSTPIWVAIDILSFVQFPWRFLGLTIFALSLSVGALAGFRYKFSKKILMFLIFLTIALNYQYFNPWNRSFEITDEEKLSGIAFELQQKSAILDYLPNTAPVAPKEKAPDKPWAITGNANAYNYVVRSNSFFFDVEVVDEATVQVPVMYFPGWTVITDGEIIDGYPHGKYGAITINLGKGKHIIEGRFINTPIRDIGNLITMVSTVILFVGSVFKANGKKFLWV